MAGFLNVVPPLGLSATERAGYAGALPFISFSATEELAEVEVPTQNPPPAGPVSAPGAGFAPYKSPGWPRRDEPFIEAWEDDDEELIIALCAAFLEMIE